MGRPSKITLLTAISICAVTGGGYWYFQVFPIQKAESTALEEIFLEKRIFDEIEANRITIRLRAIAQGWDDKLPQIVDCNNPKYTETARKLGTSIAYNNQVNKVRSAERAASQFAEKGQAKLARQALIDALLRFRTAEVLKKEIECFEMARERVNPSY